MTQVTNIPDEVRVQFPGMVKEAIKNGLSTEPANRPKAERALSKLYEVCNLNPNVPIVWVETPMIGAYAASIADVLINNKLPKTKKVNVEWTAELQSVNDAVNAAVGSKIEPHIIMSILKSKRLKWHNYRGGQFWISWPTFIKAIELLGVKHESFVATQVELEICESAGWYWPNEHFIIISERPTVIKLDAQGRLHCENGPAIDYGPKFQVFSWHGTAVPKEWILNKKEIDPSVILRESDVQKRMAGIEMIGWPRLLNELDVKTIAGDKNTELGAVVEMKLPGLATPGRFLLAQCPRNGTICEGVPNVSDIDGLPIDTPESAQAWRIGVSTAEFQQPRRRT